MTYHLEHGIPVQKALRRIALDQIDKAIDETGAETTDAQQAVHQARKRCKKLRALLRLVRPSFKGYKAENVAFRDAAGALSSLRDAEAQIETYDALVTKYEDQIERRAFASIRRRLTLRKKAAEQDRDIEAKLAAFREAMVEARERARGWRLETDGYEAVAGGLAKTYQRARKTMAAARKDASAQALHEWRKRVKYHWYHARLLDPIWPETLKAHRKAADELAELLGDHHDLAVLRAELESEPAAFGDPADLEVFLGMLKHRQATLEGEAFTLGARLLAEPADALVKRWQAYWDVWRSAENGRWDVIAA